MASFQADHPDIHHWLVTNAPISAYARNLLKRLHETGALSPGQADWVRRKVAGDKLRHRGLSARKPRSPAAEAIVAMTRRWPPEEDH